MDLGIFQALKEREINIVFNMGLRTAIEVLEKAEHLSPEGRRRLAEELRRNIAENE